MDISPHDALNRIIHGILLGESFNEDQMEGVLEHVSVCSSCQQRLLAVADLMADMPERVSALLQHGCYICRLMLPQYVEHNEQQAGRNFPFVWEHLQNCEECREQKDILRWLVDSKEEFGALPHITNTQIMEPNSKGAPRRIRLIEKVRVFWRAQKSLTSMAAEFTAAKAGMPALSAISINTLVPSYMGPVESEIQAIDYMMPQGLNLSVSIAYANRLFDLTVTCHLEAHQSGRIHVKLFNIKENARVLLAVELRTKGEKSAYRGLSGGQYELHFEATIGGELSTWEIPIELGGEGYGPALEK